MRDWYSALPQTEEILIPSIGRLIRRGRLRADVGMMMRDALYHRDPMQGPPVPGRLPADEHKARRAALLDGGPPTP